MHLNLIATNLSQTTQYMWQKTPRELPEIQKLHEEERLKDACSKGQRTAEKLAKENYSLHNEIQGW